MVFLTLFKDYLKDLDMPVPWEERGYFKKGKVRVVVINEDGGGTVYFRKFPKSHIFEIKRKYYFFVSKCVLNLDFPTIIFFFNNPKPLFLGFRKSDLSSAQLYSPEELAKLPEPERVIAMDTYLDAETVKLLGNALYMKGLMPSGWLTWRALLIILVVVLVIVLIVLQATCKVDLLNMERCKGLALLLPMANFWRKK